MNENDAPDISQLIRDYMEKRIEMEKIATEIYPLDVGINLSASDDAVICCLATSA